MDPYLMMRSDVRQGLLDLSTKLRSYQDAASTAESNTLSQQVRSLIKRLTEDLEALDRGVTQTFNNPAKFGLSKEEVMNRQAFVKESQDQLLRLISQYESAGKGGRGGGRSPRNNKGGPGPSANDEDNSANNDFLRDEMAKQAQLRANQELAIEDLTQGTRRVRIMADNITVALKEDEAARDELEAEMDGLSGRLKTANKRLDDLMRKSSDKSKFICIAVLILILLGMVTLLVI